MRHHYGVTSTLIRSMPHTIHVYLAENTPICRMVFGKTGQRKVSRPTPPSLNSLSYSWLKNKIKLDATYYFIMLMLGSTPLCPSSGAHDDRLGYHIGRMRVRTEGCNNLRSGLSSILPAISFSASSNSRTRRPMW